MDYTTILLIIVLVFFAILFILLIAYVILINKSQKSSKGSSTKMPPLDYMKNEGSKCPDYWVYMGPDKTKSNHHLCQNQFNIPVSSSDKCYTDVKGKIMSFRDADMDENGNMNIEAKKQMCEFVKNCGPTASSTASWLGINSDQLSPGWVNCGKI